MDNKILIMTVGGSDQPLVSSIKANKPDYVYFICSADKDELIGSFRTVDGSGKPCGEERRCPKCSSYSGSRRDSIVKQAGLKREDYNIVMISDLDDLNECYLTACEVIKSIRKKTPTASIVADYTGGTKSMSSGLAAAVMDDGDVEICIVRGIRKNMHVVEEGTQSARLIENNRIFIQKKISTISLLWENHDYQSCISLINDIFSSRPINPAITESLDKILALCKGFEAWDRFDHTEARLYLKTFEKHITSHVQFLGQLICVKENWPDDNNPNKKLQKLNNIDKMNKATRANVLNYSPVVDLYLNSERRANQGRYDDAVARLYRALEMFAQINLLRWDTPLFTSNLDPQRLPDRLKNSYIFTVKTSKSNTVLGLLQSYSLLADIGAPVGKVFKKHESKLRLLLDKRNNSLMAHGISPISEEDFKNANIIFKNFIEEAFAKTTASIFNFQTLQFPGNLLKKAGLL